ncbi:MAG: hypothetical protein BJ554DRAFT_2457 [Olpidium bornovanus]|uniref:Choline/carnitine acyltransferase domain-containing protein n=1 Tax=Olpidium bornovanus TaxID=278681 RepID=A0A8H8A0Y2_9FUNG|nr:MAG: hypothetical protein BJ554DRAFT_2457 [Olpidium bornovanus]
MVCRPPPTCRLRLSRTSRLPPAGLGAAAVGRRAACREGTFSRLFATKHAEEAVKTFANQEKLPRLPVPTLQETVARHMKSLRPILPDNEFEQAGKAASRFVEPGGVGEVLQRRLLEHDALEPNSWLENIWLSKAYLEWREPSYVNVNWWGQFKDMPDMPSTAHGAPTTGKATPLQVRRASGLLSNLLNYSDMLNRETLPPEFLGRKKQPLDMDQYRKQFGTSRIADSPADHISSQYPCLARHIVVFYKDQIYKVDVLGEKGQRVSVAGIER